MPKMLAGRRVAYTRKPNSRGAYSANMVDRNVYLPENLFSQITNLGPDFTVTRDEELGAGYITFAEGFSHRTVEVEPELGPISILVDFDAQDRVMGVEVLWAGEGEVVPPQQFHAGDAVEMYSEKFRAPTYGDVLRVAYDDITGKEEVEVTWLGEDSSRWYDIQQVKKTERWWRTPEDEE